jgi:hypothetical protein
MPKGGMAIRVAQTAGFLLLWQRGDALDEEAGRKWVSQK